MSVYTPGLGDPDPYKSTLAIQQLAQGRSNAVGSVTLTANDTTTVVAAPACGAGSRVFLFPETAAAAAVVATTYVLTTDVIARQFTVTHSNTAAVDKTFSYVCLG